MSTIPKNYISQPVNQSFTPPKTPPPECAQPIFHSWPEPETEPEQSPTIYQEPSREFIVNHITVEDDSFKLQNQEVLLLHRPKQRYEHTSDQPIPELQSESDMLVAVEAIGLNPIDWKAPDYGYGLPALPCISGRDFAGTVVKPPRGTSRFGLGDKIMAISTDYRDSKRSAFQQYALVSDFNACKLPDGVNTIEAAPLGVAFVAASIALGVCLGVNFSSVDRGPCGIDLLQTVRSIPRDSLPPDIRTECFDGIRTQDRPKKGDWIAIWGASSASGCCAVQLAKLAGLRVIAVIDVARSGERMLKHGADLLVDRFDTKRAVSIIQGVTKGRLRYGLDTVGKDSASHLSEAMQKGDGKSSDTIHKDEVRKGHIVGLTGIPKQTGGQVGFHSVPIKLFHEVSTVGKGLMVWLEELLRQKVLLTPDIEVAPGGLKGINSALDRLRDGSVNGPRLVVPLTTS
ncbi:hypothetical protein HYFRA_00007132 [Hymenoscyphus fraxineus]|uniref:Uncharacterized protein n=1 Tax=Hymenoscyphus fraxineus TaxID=746836 RepID=A0A9N9PV17_9HELO|nr:hypothetical protein HYFRA_00007132 [Hymenoscyphus fraxineus]